MVVGMSLFNAARIVAAMFVWVAAAAGASNTALTLNVELTNTKVLLLASCHTKENRSIFDTCN